MVLPYPWPYIRTTSEARYLLRAGRRSTTCSGTNRFGPIPFLDGVTGPAMPPGGFTTRILDSEWSDRLSRASAETSCLDYYRATGKLSILERGVAALRHSSPFRRPRIGAG